MSEQPQAQLKFRNRRAWIGLPLTGLYLFGLAAHVYMSGSNPLKLDLNELGDFLAGVFGPLAFLWLVLGYFQQGEELKHSTDALALQAQELAASVKAQQQLVEVELKRIEVESSRHAAERKRQSDAIQPRLTIHGAYEGDHENVVTWCLTVHNAGRHCTQFQMANLGGEGSSSKTLLLPLLRHDETHDLAIDTDKTVGVRAFVVSYTDEDGVEQAQSFMAREASDEDEHLYLVFDPLSNVFKPDPRPAM
ncbi:hypothetical protein [Pseudorhodoferax soli]|uniref:Uncharacterized protein n=1 Tax=Pseudorhodoferax soli TaxID=545864 RepID=A0A368XBF4_9BURK|nr:hypothetical protein [Pseudorhodoferax soli]RCW65185.1 hypothetical protein DES41_113109 [Pseudorhodoferax soli]